MRRRRSSPISLTISVLVLGSVLLLAFPSLPIGGGGALRPGATLTAKSRAPGPVPVSESVPSSHALLSSGAKLPTPTVNGTVAYGNATIVLPNWNSLADYAWSCNYNETGGTSSCFTPGELTLGYGGCQVPLVSWTADGAFYVNASFELVFYSFADRSVTPIAPWLPLYDNVMWYAGVTNTEYITTDGAYIYEFGALSPNALQGSGVPVTTYAVNVTTGRTFERNWTSVRTSEIAPAYSSYLNSQVNMVGTNGNDSILTLTVGWSGGGVPRANGTILAYDLWTGAEWKVTDLPYFEANNLYWVPEFQSYLDIAADDLSNDSVVQVLLTGPSGHPIATVEPARAYTTPIYGIGGVNGLWINVTARQVAFTADWQGHGEALMVMGQFDPQGILTSFPFVAGPYRGALLASPLAGEHRSSVVGVGPAFVGQPSGAPTEWLANPGSKVYEATNVTQAFEAWNMDGSLSYNTSYGILTTSDQCFRTGTGTRCAILGTAPQTVPGTIWWTWRLGLPEFPYSPAAPLAEPDDPAPVSVGVYQSGGTVTLYWRVSGAPADPMINYSIQWTVSPSGARGTVALDGSATSYSIGGLTLGETVSYTLTAWNLHGPAVTQGQVTLAAGAPLGAPTVTASYAYDLGVSYPGAVNVTVNLTEPSPGTIENDSLLWGIENGTWQAPLSARALGLPVGSGEVTFRLSDLALGTTYRFEGYSWSAWGPGRPSAVIALTTPRYDNLSCQPWCNPSPQPIGNGVALGIAGSALGLGVLVLAAAVIGTARGRRPPAHP